MYDHVINRVLLSLKDFFGFPTVKPFFLLIFLVFIHIGFVYPPLLELDSESMYLDALTLRYVDYWPPLTLLLWHGLARIKEGADLMLFLNLAFLWSSCLIGMRLFKGKKIAFWFPFIPFVPSIFLDSGEILKDTIFSFGYVFIAMILSYLSYQNKKLNKFQTAFTILGVFYFSMVKVQAQFIFPFMVAWVVCLQPSFAREKKKDYIIKVFLFIFVCLGIKGSMSACTGYLIKQEDNAHFWQYVKIYDLAGMSVFSKKNYVPPFLFKHPGVTVEEIEACYDYLWEPLIKSPRAPLISTKNDQQRQELVKAWRKAVLEDPLSYIKHRGRLWIKILGGSILKGKYIEWTKDSSLSKLAPIFSLFSFFPLFPFCLYFFWLGLKNIRKYSQAMPLFMFSGMGLSLTLVLFIFSLAAAGRYIYFSWCCFMFSLPFAYEIYGKTRTISSK